MSVSNVKNNHSQVHKKNFEGNKPLEYVIPIRMLRHILFSVPEEKKNPYYQQCWKPQVQTFTVSYVKDQEKCYKNLNTKIPKSTYAKHQGKKMEMRKDNWR